MSKKVQKTSAEDNWWKNLPKEVQQAIMRAEKQLKDGKGIPHELVMEKYKRYLSLIRKIQTPIGN